MLTYIFFHIKTVNEKKLFQKRKEWRNEIIHKFTLNCDCMHDTKQHIHAPTTALFKSEEAQKMTTVEKKLIKNNEMNPLKTDKF